eukprot:g83.t1
MLSRVYRHRETCGTVQAVLFGRKVGKDEDGFVEKFGSAFGFTVRWVHTDRKSQYLFKKQETYKWASVNKSMVTQRFEKPVAEKEIFHLKLVSDFARQRGKKDCHPLKIVCDRWEKSGFIECVVSATERAAASSSSDEQATQRVDNDLHELGWVDRPEGAAQVARILFGEFGMPIDRTMLKELKRNLMMPAGASTGTSRAECVRAFMKAVRWSPTQYSTSIRAYLHAKAGRPSSSVKLNASQLGALLAHFKLNEQQLQQILNLPTVPANTPTGASAGAGVGMGAGASAGASASAGAGAGAGVELYALLLQAEAIMLADTGGCRLPLTKTVVTQFNPPSSCHRVMSAAGPWSGGNVVEIQLSRNDIIKLTRQGYDRLATRADMKAAKAAADGAAPASASASASASAAAAASAASRGSAQFDETDYRVVAAECIFTFQSASLPDSTAMTTAMATTTPTFASASASAAADGGDGVGDGEAPRAVAADVYGYTDACKFGFFVVVPACPWPAPARGGGVGGRGAGGPAGARGCAQLASVQVKAWVYPSGTAAAAAAAGAGGAAGAGAGGPPAGLQPLLIADQTIDGGYLYLDARYERRAQQAEAFAGEVDALRGVASSQMQRLRAMEPTSVATEREPTYSDEEMTLLQEVLKPTVSEDGGAVVGVGVGVGVGGVRVSLVGGPNPPVRG